MAANKKRYLFFCWSNGVCAYAEVFYVLLWLSPLPKYAMPCHSSVAHGFLLLLGVFYYSTEIVVAMHAHSDRKSARNKRELFVHSYVKLAARYKAASKEGCAPTRTSVFRAQWCFLFVVDWKTPVNRRGTILLHFHHSIVRRFTFSLCVSYKLHIEFEVWKCVVAVSVKDVCIIVTTILSVFRFIYFHSSDVRMFERWMMCW